MTRMLDKADYDDINEIIKARQMLGVAHIATQNSVLHLPKPCGQDYKTIKIAVMDDGTIECFDYYRHCGRGACKDCTIKHNPKGY